MKRLWVGMIIGVLFQYAALGTVKFKKDVFALQAEAGKAYRLNLLELLADKGSGPLKWAVSHSLPSWVSLDSVDSVLYGTPTVADGGTKTFRLVVTEAQTGSVTNIEMRVKVPAVWTTNPVDLGLSTEGRPFFFDLRGFLSNVANLPLKFGTDNLPSWLNLSPRGTLSGVPRKSDVGKFTARITAGSELGSMETTLVGEVVAFNESKPNFKAALFELKATPAQVFSLDANSLLSRPLSDACVWTSNGSPKWISLDSKSGALSGTPSPASGGTEVRFSLNFQCEQYGSRAEIHLVVDGQPNLSAKFFVKERKTLSTKLPLPISEEGTEVEKNEFVLVDKSDWVTVFSNGELEAQPLRRHVGSHVFHYRVTNERRMVVEGAFQIDVMRDSRPPIWSQNPIQFTGKENTIFGESLCPFAMSPDGEPITMLVSSLPNWLHFDGVCRITGVPSHADVGVISFETTAKTQSGASQATVSVKILKMIPSPTWVANPLKLPSAHPGMPYSADLSASVSNAGFPLAFTKVSGPNWLSVNNNGMLGGTPGKNDTGVTTAVVTVAAADGQHGSASSTNVLIEVVKLNEPAHWSKKKIALPAVREGQSFCTDLNPYVANPNGGQLNFSIDSGGAWMTLKDRFLCGQPAKAEVGKHRFVVSVSDGQSRDSTVATIQVIHVNHPPTFLQDPINFSAISETPFSSSLASAVVDPDGDPLTCRKLSGPAWVNVGLDLSLAGTPRSENVGENPLVVSCSDGGGLSVSATVIINVTAKTKK